MAQFPNFYTGYTEAKQRNQQAGMADLLQLGQAQGILGKMQEQQERAQITAALRGTRSLEEGVAKLQAMGTPAAIKMAHELSTMASQRMDMEQKAREQAVFSPASIASVTTPGQPAQPAVTPNFPSDDEGNAMPSFAAQPATAPQVDLNALRQRSMMTSPRAFEAGSAHIAGEQNRQAMTEGTTAARNQTAAIQVMAIQEKAREADQRSRDTRLTAQERADARREAIQARREIAAAIQAGRQPAAPVAIVGPDGKPVLVSREDAIGKTPTTAAIDFKSQAALSQDTSALQSITSDLDRLAAEANALKEHPGLQRATGAMSIVPVVGGTLTMPGTDPANFKERLGTLKSQVAFGVLQNMRNNSKTGGALGQVSDKEGQLLQDNLAALGRAQSPKEFSAALERIVAYTDQAKDRLRQAYDMKHGDKTTAAPKADPLGIR